MLPVETSSARSFEKNAAGRAFTAFSSPPFAKSSMSSMTTSSPAFAMCAAIPLPITPAPTTPTLRTTSLLMAVGILDSWACASFL